MNIHEILRPFGGTLASVLNCELKWISLSFVKHFLLLKNKTPKRALSGSQNIVSNFISTYVFFISLNEFLYEHYLSVDKLLQSEQYEGRYQ